MSVNPNIAVTIDVTETVTAIDRAEIKAVDKLDALLPNDPEESHLEAEAILCELLRKTGLSAVADAFEAAKDRAGFWYS